MARSIEHFEDLCIGYLQNSLSHDEMKEFQANIENLSPEEQSIYTRHKRMALLARGSHDESAPTRTKYRIVDQIEKQEKGFFGKVSDRFFAYAIAGFGYVAAIVILGLFVLQMKNMDKMKELFIRQDIEIATLKTQLQKDADIVGILAQPDAVVTNLKGLDVSPQSSARIYWSASTQKAAVRFFNLPPPPAGQDYQLWVISEGKPVSAGVLNITAGVLENPIPVTGLTLWEKTMMSAFTITLEPIGGVPQPTGAMYLMGEI